MDGGLDVGGHCRALVFIGARWCALSVEVLLLCLYLCVVFVLMGFVGMIVWSNKWGVEGTTGEGEEWAGEPGEGCVGEPSGRGIAARWASVRGKHAQQVCVHVFEE